MAEMATNKRPAEAVEGEDAEAKRRKQERADRMAAIKARMAGNKVSQPPLVPAQQSSYVQPTAAPTQNPPQQSGSEDIRTEAARKIAELRARMQNRTAQAIVSSPSRASTDIQAQIAEARAKAAALAAQRSDQTLPGTAHGSRSHDSRTSPEINSLGSNNSDPRSVRGGLKADLHPALQNTSFASAEGSRSQEKSGRGGLSVGLHPSLLDPSANRAANNQRPKFSTTKGNKQPEKPKENPYLADEDEAKDPQFKALERKSKALSFFEHGKFIAQGNAQREAAELEEMKRRIALDARKTEMEEASDRAFVVQKPPSIEWWDEAALPAGHTSYESLDEADLTKIAFSENAVSDLVCHPVLLMPPQEKFLQPMKPLMLTSKEMAKLRRQRRRADMKEEQARIRMGLVPPPPPKVKKSNMMRVLGEQAVKDPTAVEARVNREIAQRQHDHESSNAERALTKEQRYEKLKSQQSEDAAKGLKIAVFRVDDLSSGKHRYQVDIGAKQNALTGVVIMNPSMYLIIVEGGDHSMKNFKKLMLNRIKWAENEPPKANSNPTTFTGTRSEDASRLKGKGSKAAEWCNPYNEDGSLKDLSANRCMLVWEGDETELKYKKWEPRTCETDGEAKDFLKRTGMENMWTLARCK